VVFPLLIFLFLCLELIIISYIDVKKRKISNYWSLINILLFLVCLFVYPDSYRLSLATFFYPLAWLFVGFFLFAFKIMGGGDSKYLFSFFLLVPEAFHEFFLLKLIYSTVVVGLILLIFNTLKNFDTLKQSIAMKDVSYFKQIYGTRFSFAPVIALSWMIFGWEIKSLLKF